MLFKIVFPLFKAHLEIRLIELARATVSFRALILLSMYVSYNSFEVYVFPSFGVRSSKSKPVNGSIQVNRPSSSVQ